jgi:hypothetical protein
MDNKQREKEKLKKADHVADKMYEAADYKSDNPMDKGIGLTHEQVSDTYTEGTIDGKIDAVDKDGQLKSHDGEPLRKRNSK